MEASTFVGRLSRSTQRDKDNDIRVRVYGPGDRLLCEGKATQSTIDRFGSERECFARLDPVTLQVVDEATKDEYVAASLAAAVSEGGV